MAPGWEMAMDLQDSMSSSPATNMYGLAPTGQALRVDGLLDFSHHNLFSSSTSSVNVAGTQLLVHPTQDHTTPAANYVDLHHPRPFPDDLYIPSDEVAELEWLSQFVEDSFSYTPYPSSSNTTTHHQSQLPPPWSTQPPPPQRRSTSSSTTSSSSSSDITSPKAATSMNKRKVQSGEAAGDVRRCTHCSSEKTPQWRTGPLGPKTLCNACGVRFKSGRLVPEYRPAASPTFVLSHHSNSHRKVVELRRQKELLLQHRHGHNPSDAGSADRPELLFHDYEVC